MLNRLQISGLALLEDCALDFPGGLTVISGETGAGKTMILTSLRLLMGGRAEPSLVKQGGKATEVDGVFSIDNEAAEGLVEAGYFVEDGEVILSRTVPAEGRSKAAIASRPVPAKMLADTLSPVVTIHGQADQFRLRGSGAQMALLDTYAGPDHKETVQTYRGKWAEVAALKALLEDTETNAGLREVELKYLTETVSAIEEFDPAPDEEEVLANSIERLTNVEELRAITSGALEALRGSEVPGASDLVAQTLEALRRAVRLDGDLEPLTQRAEAIEIDIQSLIEDLGVYVDDRVDDPEELARLHARRASLTDLMRGRATSAEDLLTWAQTARERVAELRSDAANPEALRKELEEQNSALLALADKVSNGRKEAAANLATLVTKELQGLALGEAKFFVEVEPVAPGPQGADRITMMFKPHPNAPATPISQGASGGELSRIMLALEVVLADQDRGRTFIFDEIDAGIGGETVISVGERLRRLAAEQQVIVVTHQPQIAALADRNFVVTKKDGVASVRDVRGEERTEELVRMLGGEGDTDATRRHAVELERRARVTQSKP